MNININIHSIAIKLANTLRINTVGDENRYEELIISNEEQNKLLSFLHGYISPELYVKDDLYERLGKLARYDYDRKSLDLHARPNITPKLSLDLLKAVCQGSYDYSQLKGIVTFAMGMSESQLIALLGCLDELDRTLLENFYCASEDPHEDWEDECYERMKRSISNLRFLRILRKFFKDNTFVWSASVIETMQYIKDQKLEESRHKNKSKKRTEDGDCFRYTDEGKTIIYCDTTWQGDLDLEFINGDMKKCKI